MRTRRSSSRGQSFRYSVYGHNETSADPVLIRCHMFYGQRVMDIPDGLPKWSGINKESDLIEDSPPELVKEFERKREDEREEKFKKGENK